MAPSATIPSPQSTVLLTVYRAALWLALLLYPWSTALLFQSAGLKARSPMLATVAVILNLAWTLAAPVAGLLALYQLDRSRLPRSEYRSVFIEAVAGVISPPFMALSTSLLVIAGLASHRVAFWYICLALVAATRLLPSSAPASGKNESRLQRVHRISALLLLLFGVAHVGNHLFAIESLSAHVAVQNVLRAVYRQPVIETVLILAVLAQILTGARMVWRSRHRRANWIGNLQLLSGAYMAMFFMSHVTAVLILGRQRTNADTTFSWATGGPKGLLSGPGGTTLLPYYYLSVIAFCVHAGCASRWSLSPLLGELPARRLSYAVMAAGVVVSTALLFPILGFHLA